MRSSAPSYLHKSRCPSPVLRGGRSFGIARHWHPVLKIYIIPFITSRSSTWRLLPPRLAGGINGSTSAHSSSVRSLGYRNALRSYRPRFFAVHIGDPPRIRPPLLNHKRFRRFNMFSDRHLEKQLCFSRGAGKALAGRGCQTKSLCAPDQARVGGPSRFVPETAPSSGQFFTARG